MQILLGLSILDLDILITFLAWCFVFVFLSFFFLSFFFWRGFLNMASLHFGMVCFAFEKTILAIGLNMKPVNRHTNGIWGNTRMVFGVTRLGNK